MTESSKIFAGICSKSKLKFVYFAILSKTLFISQEEIALRLTQLLLARSFSYKSPNFLPRPRTVRFIFSYTAYISVIIQNFSTGCILIRVLCCSKLIPLSLL